MGIDNYMKKEDRVYATPCCPACQEECQQCCHQKMYEDEKGEWQTEDDEE